MWLGGVPALSLCCLFGNIAKGSDTTHPRCVSDAQWDLAGLTPCPHKEHAWIPVQNRQEKFQTINKTSPGLNHAKAKRASPLLCNDIYHLISRFLLFPTRNSHVTCMRVNAEVLHNDRVLHGLGIVAVGQVLLHAPFHLRPWCTWSFHDHLSSAIYI